ncbi:MAG: extracellular solute-binding protein [Spirochaetaceae bacterium]|nr:MAG: extracellular solute-binding protein [Spirochaetaceae bacterium]
MKRICIILVCILALPFFSFAEGQADEPATKPTISTIKATLDIVLKEEDRRDLWVAEFKKLTGIQLVVNQPLHAQYQEKLRIMIASGEIPDIYETMPTQAALYAKDGAAIALDDFAAANPNIAAIPGELIDSYRMKDGKLYFFPLQLGGGCLGYIRKDWLDNLGLKMPTTYEEMVEVLEAFTKKDPDQDGKADTVGYSVTLTGDAIFQDMYNRLVMLDAKGNFTKKAGVWVDGFSQPEMAQALGRWQDLYKRGIVDPEIFTNTTSIMREKFFQGRLGLFEYWAGKWGFNIQRDTRTGDTEKAVVVPLPAIKGARYLNRLAPVFCISTKTKDPKAVFDNFIGLMWDKGRGQMLFTYGVEGMHWKKGGAPGTIEMLPGPSNPKVPWGKAYLEPTFTLNDWKLPFALDKETMNSLAVWRANLESVPLESGGPVYDRGIGQLHLLRLEIFSKITKGDLTIEAGMKLYADRAKTLGVETMIKELNS